MTDSFLLGMLFKHEEEVRFSPYDVRFKVLFQFVWAGLCVPAFLLPMEVFSH